MAKVINLKGKSFFQEVVEEMMEFDRQGLVTDLVLTYRRNYSDEEKKAGEDTDTGQVCRYWFGETSSIFCLGLNQNMNYIIQAFINGEDLIDGD